MVKAILIDLDGTLVDTTPALYQVYLKFLEHYGHKGTKDEFNKLIGPSIDEIVEILHKKYKLPGNPRDLASMYVSMIMLQGFEGTQLFPGAKEVLESAKKENIKLGIVTSGTHALVKVCLDPLRVRHLFDVIVTSEDVSKAKPHPELYQLALKKLSIQPHEAVAIEDSPAGVDAASKADLQVITFTHGGKADTSKEKVVYLPTWQEIGTWLQLR